MKSRTTWFERHGSTPITEIPAEWPEWYRRVVARRIELIESDPNIALIERPEYKRRWNTEPWDSQLERALNAWLLNRLESHFDFEGRMNEAGNPTARLPIGLTTVGKLADIARKDADFLQVGELYRDDPAFDVTRLVAELVEGEKLRFPHCEGEDGSLMIAWAGYDHLQLARAISAYYVDVQERLGGRDDPRLVPLLACLIELLPWLKQWHNEVDPEFGVPMGDYFEGFVQEEARHLGKTLEEIRCWQPAVRGRTRRSRGRAARGDVE